MKRYSKLAILIILKAAVMIGGLVQAAEPPEEPILRIETGMHTAKINRIGVDAAERILVTASDDKTVRVWDIATGNLIKILRVPIGWTKEGMIYAVAISPDGKTVAAGGWTGYSWDKEYSIYIFDSESENLIRRISGHPAIIRHLIFSKDGKYLAAALLEKGIRIYETDTWALKAQDTDYGNRSDWIDFDKNGRLITTSVDGFLRLYDNKFRLISKKQYSGGKEPFSACFSPDTEKIAVIFRDSPKVYIVSGTDLSYSYLSDTDGVDRGIISSVAWSSDGTSLYIGGADKNETTSVIRKWTQEGRGSYTDIPAADNTVMHIIALKNGGIVFGSADPAFGIIDKNDKKIFFKTSQIGDFRDNHNNFMVSDDGNIVKFGYEPFKNFSAIFSISSRMIVHDAPVEGLAAPITTADGMDISGWKNSFFPIFNRKSIELEQYEVSRSLALSKDKQHFLIGTELMLRLFDRNGNLKWCMPSPGVAWCVNISGDGKKVIAAFSDGTIRWYRISDHRKLLTFFPHKDGKRWILWTPSGYYAASAGGDDLIGWHVNNGKDKTPDFFPASRFRSV